MPNERIAMSLSLESPTDDTDWATLEALGVALAESLPVRAIVTVLHAWQVSLVDRVCGPSGEPVRGLPAPFGCPRCHAREDFARKGRRNRLRRLDTYHRHDPVPAVAGPLPRL